MTLQSQALQCGEVLASNNNNNHNIYLNHQIYIIIFKTRRNNKRKIPLRGQDPTFYGDFYKENINGKKN